MIADLNMLRLKWLEIAADGTYSRIVSEYDSCDWCEADGTEFQDHWNPNTGLDCRICPKCQKTLGLVIAVDEIVPRVATGEKE